MNPTQKEVPKSVISELEVNVKSITESTDKITTSTNTQEAKPSEEGSETKTESAPINEKSVSVNQSENLTQNETSTQTIHQAANSQPNEITEPIHEDLEQPQAPLEFNFTSEPNIPPNNINSEADTEVANTVEHHSELSNDIFATLSVSGAAAAASGGHPESMSPTAAFLLAFPLVSTLTGGGSTSVTANKSVGNGDGASTEDNSDSRQDTPTLLQIGTMETTSGTVTATVNTTAASSDSGNGALLGLDSFSSFFGTQSSVVTSSSCYLGAVEKSEVKKSTEEMNKGNFCVESDIKTSKDQQISRSDQKDFLFTE